jgi:hypothetical protein
LDGDAEEGVIREELLMGIIRGEIPYVHEDAGEGAGQGAEEGEEEDVLSFLNPSDDGMDIEMFDEGQTDNDDDQQLQTNTDGEVYYIEPLVI